MPIKNLTLGLIRKDEKFKKVLEESLHIQLKFKMIIMKNSDKINCIFKDLINNIDIYQCHHNFLICLVSDATVVHKAKVYNI